MSDSDGSDAAAADARTFKEAMARFASGVTVIAADDGATAHGLTVASFASASLAPPLCLACVGDGGALPPIARRAGRFSAHVLAADQKSTAELFAYGAPDERRAALIRRPGAPPALEGALVSIDAQLVSSDAVGDHLVLVGLVIGAVVGRPDAAPLLWWRRTLGGPDALDAVAR